MGQILAYPPPILKKIFSGEIGVNMKTITVFGGSGFVGRYVIKRLAAQGHTVSVICQDIEAAKFLKPMGAVGQVTPIAIDLSDEEAVRSVVKNADAVINLVGILVERKSKDFEKIHHEFPSLLAKVCREKNINRLVHVSALSINHAPQSKYAASKLAGDEAVMAIYPAATIFRPSIIAGAEDNFFNRFAKIAQLSPVLPLIGGGKTKFQPVYVGDVADAIVASIATETARGQVYALVGPKVYTFKELMQLILKEIRVRRWLMPLPFFLAKLKATFLQLLPHPLLTRDQVELLKTDNILRDEKDGLQQFRLHATNIESIIPSYLKRFRRGGQWDYEKAESVNLK